MSRDLGAPMYRGAPEMRHGRIKRGRMLRPPADALGTMNNPGWWLLGFFCDHLRIAFPLRVLGGFCDSDRLLQEHRVRPRALAVAVGGYLIGLAVAAPIIFGALAAAYIDLSRKQVAGTSPPDVTQP